MWHWLGGLGVLLVGLLWLFAVVSSRRKRRRAPVLLEAARGHIGARRWTRAAEALLEALPYGTKRADVPTTRQIVDLACRIDAQGVEPHFGGTKDELNLRQELERVEAHGGAADWLGPLEQYLRRVAAGDDGVLFRDAAPALLRAVLDDQADAVAKLLEAGEDPNSTTLGRVPLAFALDRGNLQVIWQLVRAGATAGVPEVEGLFHLIVMGDAATADALYLAEWLADHPLFDVEQECHATTQTLLGWAEMTGANDLADKLRRRRA